MDPRFKEQSCETKKKFISRILRVNFKFALVKHKIESLKSKGKLYRAATKLAPSECRAFRKDYSRKMGVAEKRMLRWMSGHTLRIEFEKKIYERV